MNTVKQSDNRNQVIRELLRYTNVLQEDIQINDIDLELLLSLIYMDFLDSTQLQIVYVIFGLDKNEDIITQIIKKVKFKEIDNSKASEIIITRFKILIEDNTLQPYSICKFIWKDVFPINKDPNLYLYIGLVSEFESTIDRHKSLANVDMDNYFKSIFMGLDNSMRHHIINFDTNINFEE